MQEIDVLVVYAMDDIGMGRNLVTVAPSFEDMRRSISPTLINEDVLGDIEDFAASLSYPLPSNIIMLHGHDIEEMFPATGVMYAGHDSPGFVFGFIDGPFVFVKTDGAEYTTLDDSDIDQINGFLDCAYNGFYGGDEYIDYSPRAAQEEEFEEQLHAGRNHRQKP